MDRWFVSEVGGEPEGPFTTQEIQTKIRRGLIKPSVQVCPAKGSVWVSVSDVPDFERAVRRAPTIVGIPGPAAQALPSSPGAPPAAPPASSAAAPVRTSGPSPRTSGPSPRASGPSPRTSGPSPRTSAPPQPPVAVSAPPVAPPKGKPTTEPGVAPPPRKPDAATSEPGAPPPPVLAPAEPPSTPTPVAKPRPRQHAAPAQSVAPLRPHWVVTTAGVCIVLLGCGFTLTGGQERGIAVMLLGLAAVLVGGQMQRAAR
jgi:hypothetical protein